MSASTWELRPSFAVVANGAELLVDGRPDDAWAARTSELLAADVLSPYAVAEHLGEVLAPAWTKRIISGSGSLRHGCRPA